MCGVTFDETLGSTCTEYTIQCTLYSDNVQGHFIVTVCSGSVQFAVTTYSARMQCTMYSDKNDSRQWQH